MSTFGGTYSLGTISVAANSTSVTGSGVLWGDIEEGDWLTAGGSLGVIDAVTGVGLDGITLKAPWKGSTQSGATYVIVKASWLRYEPALTQAKVRELLALLDGVGIIYYVTGTDPDPSVGNDGAYAVKINGGIWQFWLKVAGSWVFQGSPVGVTWTEAWSAATTYAVGQSVSRLGKAYISKTANTNKPPEINPSDWSLLLSTGVQYDITIWAAGRPAASEELVNIDVSRVLTFSVGMPESVAKSKVATTASKVFSVQKNGVEFGTITFAAGQSVGTFACPTLTVLNPTHALSVVAPAAQDTTLSDVSITLVAQR